MATRRRPSEPSESRSPDLTLQAAWSAIGSVAAGRFATVDAEGQVVVIGPEPTVVEHIPLVEDHATAVALAVNGSMVVGGLEGTVMILNESDGATALGSHSAPVAHAALSPDGSLAATQDLYGSLTLWDVQSGAPRWTWTLGRPGQPSEDDGFIGFVNLLDGDPAVFALFEGGPPELDPGFIENLLTGTAAGAALAFSRDGQSLHLLSDTLVSIDPTTGLPQSSTQLPISAIQMSEAPDGTVVAGESVVRNGTTERLAGVPRGARTTITPDRTTITPDGSRILALDGRGVSIYSADGDQLLASAIEREGDDVATLSADGSRLASLEYNDFTGGDTFATRLTSVATRQELWPAGVPTHWLSYTGDGHFAQWGSPQPYSITPLDETSFEETGGRSATGGWGTFEYSPDGRMLAIGDITQPEVRIHDTASGDLLHTLRAPLDEQRSNVAHLDFDATGGPLGGFGSASGRDLGHRNLGDRQLGEGSARHGVWRGDVPAGHLLGCRRHRR